jgi:hypothetical protein
MKSRGRHTDERRLLKGLQEADDENGWLRGA